MKKLLIFFEQHLAALVIFVLGCLATSMLVLVEYKNIETQRADTADNILKKYASSLQSSLDRRLFTLDALNAFLYSYAELDLTVPDEELRFRHHFNHFANELHASVEGVISLQLAPQGVIRYLTGDASNNKAMDYDLFEDDSRRTQIVNAIYDYHQVITGPIKLIQGGEAIIARKALFNMDSPNASATRLREKLIISSDKPVPDDFWGLATVLFTTESLMAKAGLSSSTLNGYDFALKGRHGLGDDGEVFWGEPVVFDDKAQVHRIEFDAGEWLLAVRNSSAFPLTSLASLALLGLLLTLAAVYAEILLSRNRKARQIDLAKDAFLASMSHEIRSPLNGVVGMTSILRQTRLNDEQKVIVNAIDTSAGHLTAVIGDILDFSKINAGKIELDYSSVQLSQLFQQCIDITLPQAKQKSQHMRLNISQSLQSVYFRTDTTRLKQIVINLLSNAVKFTESQGTIELSVRKEISQSQPLLNIMISDNGIGMTDIQQSRLFHSFSQADTSTTRKFGGSGLGLAISKNLALLMGGDITVISEIDKGSQFTLTLPFEVVDIDDDNQRPLISPETNKQNLKILVTDDLTMNQSMMVMMLEKLGYRADVADDGQMALEMQSQNEYDLIFMDWEMPEMDGVEATRLIRLTAKSERHPWIIALTANASSTHKEKCLEAGMNDYITKPISIDQIREKITKLTSTE
ncbi:ATP-binding protein [Methylophaga sp.]|uniref:ATP-binding protein n=1 Tax=Methylophaga sp. TaxID=2024840 RepID=UPI003F6A22C0